MLLKETSVGLPALLLVLPAVLAVVWFPGPPPHVSDCVPAYLPLHASACVPAYLPPPM